MSSLKHSSSSDITHILQGVKSVTSTIEHGQTEFPPLELEDCLNHQVYILKGKVHSDDSRVDLWTLPSFEIEEFLKLMDVLSVDETTDAVNITHKPTQTRHLAMRILTRLALSERSDQNIPSTQWKIEQNAYGKPELVSGQANLNFNISHTEGLSTLAIVENKSIGIDIEKINSTGIDILPFNMLSDQETETLQKLDGMEKYQYFLRIWTLKEAYSKAVGEGISLDFSTLDFTLKPISLKITDRSDDLSAAFKTLRISHFEHPYLMSLSLTPRDEVL